jgi:AraC-like DNA-binding protein
MPAKKYRIKLQIEERRHLESIVRKQKVAASKHSKANALLLCDENAPEGALKDELVAERTGMSVNTLARIRQRCGEVGPVQALERKARLAPPWVVHHREDLAVYGSLFHPPGTARNGWAGDRKFRLGRFTNGLLGNGLGPARFKDSLFNERTFSKGGSPRSNQAFYAFTTLLRRRPLAARRKN